MNFLEQNIEDYISTKACSSNEDIVFECDALDCYDLPKEEDVPEGIYAAMVIGFQNYTDKFKNCYVDVCYKIFSESTFIQWNNRYVDKITYSYVRIRIMRGSDEERRFRAAMSGLTEKKRFASNELIGVISLVNIAYKSRGVATIEKYLSTWLNGLWFEDDISDYYHWSSGYTPDDE